MSSADYGYLFHRISIRQHMRSYRMPQLMERYDLFFVLFHGFHFFLRAHNYFLQCVFKIILIKNIPIFLGFFERSLIDDILNISAHQSTGSFSQRSYIYGFIHLFSFQIIIEDEHSFLMSRLRDIYFPIKSSRSKQCRIQNIRSIGSSDHDNLCGIIKSVHFSQNLIQCLFLFLMPSCISYSSFFPYSIDLIDKDNSPADRFRLSKKLSHLSCSHTYEHFHKLRAGNREKWDIRFSCNRSCKQSLTRSWLPI